MWLSHREFGTGKSLQSINLGEPAMKKINGFDIINSHTLESGDIIILGARVLNHAGDDYEYAVATVEHWMATSWPSGKYFRTLDMALLNFNETVTKELGKQLRQRMEAERQS